MQLDRSKRKRGWGRTRRSRVRTAAVEAWPYSARCDREPLQISTTRNLAP